MCLYIREAEKYGKIATEDIKCYKVLRSYRSSAYWTPLQLCSVRLGERVEAIGEIDTYVVDDRNIGIGRGVIHTFATLEGAKEFLTEHANDYFLYVNEENDYIIVPCIIPKGTKFLRGFLKIPEYPPTLLLRSNMVKKK